MNQPTAEKPYNDSDVADVYRRQKQSTALLKLPMSNIDAELVKKPLAIYALPGEE